MPLRVLFFGTPSFAVPTLDALLASPDADVVGVVTQPDKPRGRGQHVSASPIKARAEAAGLPVLQPTKLSSGDFLEAARALAPDLGVVAAYGRLLPEVVLALPRLGLVNVHASLLPRWRGASPIERAIVEGDRETGVTIMRVAQKLDSGAMFARTPHPIDPEVTSDVLEDALASLGARLLVEVVDAIADGTAHEELQDERLVTYAPRLTKDEGLIDWMMPAQRIHDRVRGLYPWPHAYTFMDGRRVIVWRTIPLGYGARGPEGTVVHADGDGLHVTAGDGGALALLELQAEGGRPLPAADFLRGHPIQAGARFTSP